MKNKINAILRGSMTRGALFALAFGLLLLPLAHRAAAQKQDEKNKKVVSKIAGEWKLNAALSDDAKAKMQEMMKSRRGGEGGGPPQGGMGGPPPGGGGFPGGGEMPNREQTEAMRERMERTLAAPESLEISQSDTEITISETGENERTRTLYLDESKGERNDSSKVKFKKSQIVIETKAERGPKIVETYELSENGKQLIVNVKMESDFGGGLKLRRVYDAAN